MTRCLAFAALFSLLSACGDDDSNCPSCVDTAADGDAQDTLLEDGGVDDVRRDVFRDVAIDTRPPPSAELWMVNTMPKQLFYFEISPSDGSVIREAVSELTYDATGLPGAVTQLEDGSLLIATSSDSETSILYVEEPPKDGSPIAPTELGVVPDNLVIEALYTDCEGRLYAMDTGVNNTSAEGNRLIRFSGSVLTGDLSYAVISDLSEASVADIDDMAPGIDENGNITDNPGLAIDTRNLYTMNYETGTGSQLGTAGTYGVHVLGGDLFTDRQARVYVSELETGSIILINLEDFSAISSFTSSAARAYGLTGPLTECSSSFLM